MTLLKRQPCSHSSLEAGRLQHCSHHHLCTPSPCSPPPHINQRTQLEHSCAQLLGQEARIALRVRKLQQAVEGLARHELPLLQVLHNAQALSRQLL